MEMKMANEAPAQQQKRLTLDDPVGKESLDKLAELETTEINTALQLMAIKQEEVKLLAVGRRIEDERHRLFEKLLIDRGLAPNTPATIDSTSGKITVVRPQQPMGAPQAIPPQVAAAIAQAQQQQAQAAQAAAPATPPAQPNGG
jgi:hypothetical protein